jgi:adenosylmethionine-8-amino-7-oxononanoate aminotransferase
LRILPGCHENYPIKLLPILWHDRIKGWLTQETYDLMDTDALITRDLAHHWHPCTQMKDFIQSPPFIVQGAQGDYLYTSSGKIIDGISSWWCKSLGHQHPAVIQAIQEQLSKFEHVMGAYTTHPPLVELTEKLAALSGLPYTSFASDGSSAVEIALKLVIHARQIEGKSQRTQLLSLQQGYHGETLATMSISDLGLYKAPYHAHCFPCHYIPVPYTHGLTDPKSLDAEQAWRDAQAQLEPLKDTLNAIIFEPMIQGAAGMKTYSVDFLRRLIAWAKANDIYCIADEIMTGFCRTGEWFATDYTQQQADLICVSKGLTAGSLPLSAVLISEKIYQFFYDDYKNDRNFLHSHTYSGHALAISAALATINTLESESMNQKAHQLQNTMREAFIWLQDKTQKIENIRGVGGIIAADFIPNDHPRPGFTFHQEALKRQALLRPLGQTLYWFPPLNVASSTLEELTEITYQALLATL